MTGPISSQHERLQGLLDGRPFEVGTERGKSRCVKRDVSRPGFGEVGILPAVGPHQVGIEPEHPCRPLHQFVAADPLSPGDMKYTGRRNLHESDQDPGGSRIVERRPEFIFGKKPAVGRP